MLARSTDKKRTEIGTLACSTDKIRTEISTTACTTDKKPQTSTIACSIDKRSIQIGTIGKNNSVPPFLLRHGLQWSGFGSANTIFHMPVQQAGESVLLVTPLIQTDEGW